MTLLRIFVALALCCVACHLPKPKFDSTYNPEREKVGLEPLPAGWRAISVDKDFTVWAVPEKMAGRPQLSMITATYDKSQLLYEVDEYYSGKTYHSFDGTDFESLHIGYYFVEKEIGLSRVKGWYCEYTGAFSPEEMKGADVAASHIMMNISLAQADSILRAWGLKVPGRH